MATGDWSSKTALGSDFMNDCELMTMALKALELEDMACRYEKEQTPAHIANLITALRERLKKPEKKWQGLSDEERNSLWRDVIGWGDPSHDDEDLMNAIEDKLREKNYG